jgi:hypothetical protein
VIYGKKINYATQSVVPAGTTVYIQQQDQSKALYFNFEGRENWKSEVIINVVVVLSIAE